jgi:hypothetical protein
MSRSGQHGNSWSRVGTRPGNHKWRPTVGRRHREVEQVFRRRQVKTHARMMREELGVSLEHLRQAAAHAAGGTADFVAPRVDAARRSVKPRLRKARGATYAAVRPLAESTRDRARQAGKIARKGKSQVSKSTKFAKRESAMTGKRWPMLIGGMVAAGAAGVAGAVYMRRRANRSRWEEYGTTQPTTDLKTEARSIADSAKSTAAVGKDKVQSVTESAKDRAADMIASKTGDTAAHKTPSASSTGLSTSPSSDYGVREDLYGKTGTASRNSRS